MSRLQVSTSRHGSDTREQLDASVHGAAQRGRLLACVGTVLLCFAVLIGGLFIVAIKDVAFDLPYAARLALLMMLLLGSMGACLVLGIRPWRNPRFKYFTGEQIDHAADAKQQPVTLGLSLNRPIDDDSLALSLLERAESRAGGVAKSVKPKDAYPLSRLRRPGAWLALALGLWLSLAIVMPADAFNLVARVMMPWGDAPPFSLTQLAPTWAPAPPDAGDNVTVTVEPTGLMPESVAWVRLDQDGNEAERFAMIPDEQGGFSHLLKRVESPIDFRLEAYGRHTRTFTLTPTPRPPSEDDAPEDQEDNAVTGSDGATAFDPDKIARRDLEAHRDWPGIKADLQELLDQLAEAQSLAQRTDPKDVQAIQALADKLVELTDAADQIADEIAVIKGGLPAEASALLDELAKALTKMQSSALPAPPNASDRGETAASQQWLDRAVGAIKADQRQIGQGIGPSDLPRESGTVSGQRGHAPDFRDPASTGTYDEVNVSGDDGPLPKAAMQQIPPSYRALVAKYFERLSEESPSP